MRDIADGLGSWHADGVRFAIATVVRTWESAPRHAGASMAVSEFGGVVGGVSGGCVEGAVVESARHVIETGVAVLETYGVSDDQAFAVGLTCGGTMDVFIQPVDATHFTVLPVVLEAICSRRPVAVATILSGPPSVRGQVVIDASSVVGTIDASDVHDRIIQEGRQMLRRDETRVIDLPGTDEARNGISVYVQSFSSSPVMLIFGATDYANSLARMGKFLSYYVVVCDARPIFATRERFPAADEVHVRWPHEYLAEVDTDERTVVCVLTHDPKFDVPVLKGALARPAAYVGALGSRRTQADRVERLRHAGVSEDQLARLSAPIGLDLGGSTPEETAVAIAAELIMLLRGGTGQRLVDGALPIHN